MIDVRAICEFLDGFAPPELAESWDNTGLLLGRRHKSVAQMMTCLTLTPASVSEAVDNEVDLVVSHHPLPFRPVSRITDESTAGALMLQLLSKEIAVYSPHTSFDSTLGGINQSLAERLEILHPRPLQPFDAERPGVGAGRLGELAAPVALAELADWIKQRFNLAQIRVVGDAKQQIQSVAIACGSGGALLQSAIEAGASALVTGETNFHTCLEAEAHQVALFLLGHFASERFAVEMLADRLSVEFPTVRIWASEKESDPLICM